MSTLNILAKRATITLVLLVRRSRVFPVIFASNLIIPFPTHGPAAMIIYEPPVNHNRPEISGEVSDDSLKWLDSGSDARGAPITVPPPDFTSPAISNKNSS
jgi:hypothetical protein